MTWLADLPPGETDWDRYAALWPEACDALSRLCGAAWEEADPVVLELCRVRMATLLDYPAEHARRSDRARAAGLDEAKVTALAAWPTSPLFSTAERSCLAFAEQFVMDANGVTDAQVAAVTAHLGPQGCYAFVQALSALETFQRACLTLGIESAPAVDVLAGVGAGAPATPEGAQEVQR